MLMLFLTIKNDMKNFIRRSVFWPNKHCPQRKFLLFWQWKNGKKTGKKKQINLFTNLENITKIFSKFVNKFICFFFPVFFPFFHCQNNKNFLCGQCLFGQNTERRMKFFISFFIVRNNINMVYFCKMILFFCFFKPILLFCFFDFICCYKCENCERK